MKRIFLPTASSAQVLLLCVAVLGGPLASVQAHPHGLSLSLTITEEEMTLELQAQNDFIDPLVRSVGPDVGVNSPPFRQAMEQYIGRECPVKVDGMVVAPRVKTMQVRDMVEVTLVYGLKGSPCQISLVWNLYPAVEPDFPGSENGAGAAAGAEEIPPPADEVGCDITAFGVVDFFVLSPREREYIWHAERGARTRKSFVPPAVEAPVVWSIPVAPALAIVLLLGFGVTSRVARLRHRAFLLVPLLVTTLAVVAGDSWCWHLPPGGSPRVAVPEPAEAGRIFDALLRNIYRAFDYDREGDVYDVLAQSVDGPLLDEVYTSIYQSLIMRDQGGAVSKVHKVDILEATMLPPEGKADAGNPSFTMTCRWRVHGLVEHWGHVHQRINEYRATYTVILAGNTWKIGGVKSMESVRVMRPKAAPPSPPVEKGGR